MPNFALFAMQHVHVPGLDEQQVTVQLSNGFTAPKLFVNGQPAPNVPQRGRYLLRRSDGTEATAYFKFKFPDPVPVLMVDEQPVLLARPLAWYELLWAAFPILLLFVGGAVGGGLGALATLVNTQILRSARPAALRYVLSGLLSFGVFAAWMVLVVLLHSVMKG